MQGREAAIPATEGVEPVEPCRTVEEAGANTTLRFLLVYEMPRTAKQQATDDITRALREEALSGLPTHRFPLADIVAAHEAVEHGAVGKVVVDIP